MVVTQECLLLALSRVGPSARTEPLTESELALLRFDSQPQPTPEQIKARCASILKASIEAWGPTNITIEVDDATA